MHFLCGSTALWNEVSPPQDLENFLSAGVMKGLEDLAPWPILVKSHLDYASLFLFCHPCYLYSSFLSVRFFLVFLFVTAQNNWELDSV